MHRSTPFGALFCALSFACAAETTESAEAAADGNGAADSADAVADAADAADASDASADGADGADGIDGATDGTDAALVDPPLPDWPANQPGLDDPTARKWFRAGAWYKENPDELDTQMKGLFDAAYTGPLGDPAGIVTCHAGSKASGATAAKVWSRIHVPDTVIVLAPNHVNVGAPAAIWNAGPWLVPGLAVPVRDDIVTRFLELLPGELEGDRVAFEHQNAHPSEMMLPYLTRKNPNAKVVFLSFFDEEKADYANFDAARVKTFASAVATVVRELEAKGEKVLLIASMDLSHYEALVDFDPKDAIMMDHIGRFDTAGLRTSVVEGNFTICAEIAVSIWMEAMLELGYTGLDFNERGNSVHLSGVDAAVGYPAGIVWRR